MLKLRTSGLKGDEQAQIYASEKIHCVTEE